jgi:hypothetical protein
MDGSLTVAEPPAQGPGAGGPSVADAPSARGAEAGAPTVADCPEGRCRADGRVEVYPLFPREFRGMKARPLSKAGGQADLFVLDTPGGERILKLMRVSSSDRPEVAARLDAVADGLDGGAVVTYERGTDTDTGRLYEIQEYLPLGDLSGIMANGPMSEKDVMAIADSVSRTLALLHSRGIVHRDVKPANILLRSLDPLVPALCDFGISSVMAAGISLKETGKARTPLYSPPESYARIAGEAGDFWSLGAVLLEAALGSHPLAGFSENMVMMEIVTRGMPVPDGLPPSVDRLVRGLLSRDDRSRFRRKEIREILAGRHVALPEGAPQIAGAAGSGGRAARGTSRKTGTASFSCGPHPDGSPPREIGSAPFFCLGEDFRDPEGLARRFNRDPAGWEAGSALVSRGSVQAWLRDTGREREAGWCARELRGTPHEMLFAFVRMFAPDSPPAFRGTALTLANLETLAASADDPPEGCRSVLAAVLDGTLKEFPQISKAFGKPLDEASELILSSGGDSMTPETLACALAALQDPSPFIWGISGPPRGLRALAFVLKAGCPLLLRDWWERNTPPGTEFPEDLRSGPLDSPATYREGADEAMRGVREGRYTRRAAVKGIFKKTARGAVRRLAESSADVMPDAVARDIASDLIRLVRHLKP